MTKSKAHTRYTLPDSKTRLPGVTTIVGQLGWNKQTLLNWANRKGLDGIDTIKYVDNLADIGTLAHELVTNSLLTKATDMDDYSKNQIDLAQNSANSFFRWAKGKKIKPTLIETPLISILLEFGGTPDIFAEVDGVNELIDLKTGSGIYVEMVIQVSAYKHLLKTNGHTVDKVRILNIPRTNGESFIEKEITDEAGEAAWGIFIDLLHIHKLKKELR